MKILSIGGSNSIHSINRKLANHVASLFSEGDVTAYNISEIDLPLYSMQLEEEIGIPAVVTDFAEKIDETDLIVLSLAENNGSYNVGFKNLMDWTSRIKTRKTWGNKSMLLMATSPGGRGGKTVLDIATNYFPYMGAEIKGVFSLPKFQENFDDEQGITEEKLKHDLLNLINNF